MDIKQQTIPGTSGTIGITIYFAERNSNKLLVLCPGFLDSKDYLGLTRIAELISRKHEYTVVTFDPTGTWSSDGRIDNYSITQTLQDFNSIIEYMKTRGVYSHLVVGGHSLGGTCAILFAARYGMAQAVIAIMPSVKRAMTEHTLSLWKKKGVKVSNRDLPNNPTYSLEYLVPYTYALDFSRYDILLESHIVQVPVFVFAGEHDSTCTPEDIQKYCDQQNKNFIFQVIPKVDHEYRRSEINVSMVTTCIDKTLTNSSCW